MEIENTNSNKEHIIELGSLEIEQFVKNSQSQNGLKHYDYLRYRQYCTSRLQRIRKTMKFTFGKNKFVKRQIQVEKADDPKTLQVLLFNAERNWAYAMDLKQKLSNDGKQADNRRSKMHIQKKLKKAVKWAAALKDFCQKRTEKKTELEAESYHGFLSASYNFEIKNWEQSLNEFIQVRQIYSELIKISDKLQGVVFQEKIDQIDQSIRYCNHKLNNGLTAISIEDVIKYKNKSQDPTLAGKFEALLDETRKQKLENSGNHEIQYHGETYPIKNNKLLFTMQKLEENQINLTQLKGSDKSDQYREFDAIIAQYVEIFANYDEALKIIQKDKEESKDSEATQKIYVNIYDYFQFIKQQKVIERNTFQLNYAQNKFFKESDINSLDTVFSKKAQKQKLTTPFEIVRWTDNVINALKQLIIFEVNNPNIKYRHQLELEVSFYNGLRCFYVSCIYYSFGKNIECLSLIEYCDQQLQSCLNLNQKEYQLSFNMTEEVQKIRDNLKQLSSLCTVQYYKQLYSGQAQVTQQIQSVNLDGKQAAKKTLEEIIADNDGSNLSLEQMESIQIVDLPPKLQSLSCKPISFDLGFSFLQYPDAKTIESKIVEVKEQKQGLFGRASSYFFGGKK